MSTVKSKKLQVGTDASASNNFTIYQPATPDGTLRIGVGNADSPTEVGQFNSNGYKPAANSIPAFSAYQSSAQSVSLNTLTKIIFDTEEFDLTSDYDNATYRFTPSVAGYYQVNCVTSWAITCNTNLSIWKNGSGFKSGFGANLSISNPKYVASALIYMNGSTDYLEVYMYLNGGSGNMSAGASQTYFQAHLIQQA